MVQIVQPVNMLNSIIVIAAAVGVFSFVRMGIINIAFDQTILLSAAIYATLMQLYGNILISFVLALIAVFAVNAAIVASKHRFSLNDFLLTFGLLYVCKAAIEILGRVIGGKRAINFKASLYDAVPTEVWFAIVLSTFTVISVGAFVYIKSIRLAKFGSDKELISWSKGKVDLNVSYYLSAFISAVLTCTIATALVMQTATYADGMTNDVGFYALAIAVAANGKLRNLLVYSFLFAFVQLLISQYREQIADVSYNWLILAENLPGIMVIVFLCFAGYRLRSSNVRESESTNNVVIEVRRPNGVGPR